MKPDFFKKKMKHLAAFYNYELNETVTGVWWSIFKDCEDYLFNAAVKRHLTYTVYQYFPMPGMIKQALAELIDKNKGRFERRARLIDQIKHAEDAIEDGDESFVGVLQNLTKDMDKLEKEIEAI